MRIIETSTCTLTGAQWDYPSWLAVRRAGRRVLYSGVIRRVLERVVRI